MESCNKMIDSIRDGNPAGPCKKPRYDHDLVPMDHPDECRKCQTEQASPSVGMSGFTRLEGVEASSHGFSSDKNEPESLNPVANIRGNFNKVHEPVKRTLNGKHSWEMVDSPKPPKEILDGEFTLLSPDCPPEERAVSKKRNRFASGLASLTNRTGPRFLSTKSLFGSSSSSYRRSFGIRSQKKAPSTNSETSRQGKENSWEHELVDMPESPNNKTYSSHTGTVHPQDRALPNLLEVEGDSEWISMSPPQYDAGVLNQPLSPNLTFYQDDSDDEDENGPMDDASLLNDTLSGSESVPGLERTFDLLTVSDKLAPIFPSSESSLALPGKRQNIMDEEIAGSAQGCPRFYHLYREDLSGDRLFDKSLYSKDDHELAIHEAETILANSEFIAPYWKGPDRSKSQSLAPLSPTTDPGSQKMPGPFEGGLRGLHQQFPSLFGKAFRASDEFW
ncbi:uncharacterized protein ATNIH1004_003090 [Aspergillus tanneri]|uniref:Uncharacterized protein n=1 Tax=Aspergillus tanneri TaxID=1220188 RepID=A0A5M9MYG5_9EURO|nr:uncharacterized protein ATNIH1004_003090 [Aspergillus tanneri]KAA8650404.1 hypothetical protein ATNIH1004_003090 [Aspergillus tanneri]